VDDISTIRMWKAEVGDVYFTFLPFMAKSHLKPAYKSVQQYVDVKAKQIQRKMKENSRHFVFSHLMPPNCIPGTEEWMLKKVDVKVPTAFIKCKFGTNKPIIINGHVHSRQKVENIEVVGSQFFTAFGEKEKEKFFLQLDIPEWMGEGSGGLKFIKTPCKKLLEVSLELIVQTKVKDALADIFNALKMDTFPGFIMKVNLTLQPEAVGFDVQGLHEQLSALAYYVKPIHPRILRKRVKRNKKQIVKLGPHAAIQMWLKTHKPKNPNRLLKMADKYVEGVL